MEKKTPRRSLAVVAFSRNLRMNSPLRQELTLPLFPDIKADTFDEAVPRFVLEQLVHLRDEDVEKYRSFLNKKKAKNAVSAKERGDLNKGYKKYVGKLPCHSVDTGLFGRMITEKELFPPVVGAMTTAHAMSVNEYQEVLDFFTCYDDVSEVSEHLSDEGLERLLHSPLFYHHRVINMGAFFSNCPQIADKEVFEKVMTCIIKSLVFCVPGGMARKTGTNIIASGLLLEVHQEGFPISYVNAYEKPVLPALKGGLLEPAIEQLAQFVSFYDVEFPTCRRLWLCHAGTPLRYKDTDGKTHDVPRVTNAKSSAEAVAFCLSHLQPKGDHRHE